MILKTVYGYTTKAQGRDPLVDLAGETMAQFAQATVPGAFAVDVFPFRKSIQSKE